MNTLNRVLMVLLSLGTMVVLVLGLMQPGTMLMTIGYWAGQLGEVAIAQLPAYIAASVGALVLLGVLLFLELRRPEHATVKVQHTGGSVVELTTESVARGLEYHVGQVPGVMAVRPAVSSSGRAVKVMLELEIDPIMDVPGKSEEVVQLTREIIEGKLGLRLSKVIVNVHQAPYPSGLAAPAVPSEAEDEAARPADSAPPLEG